MIKHILLFSRKSKTNKSFKSENIKNPMNIFQEAIDHCRWKKVLKLVLKDIDISKYANKTFEEIIIEIYNICEKISGIGMLSVYDITSGICKYYEKNIDKVYIIGNGPKRAVKLLNLKTKKHKIDDSIRLKFVEIWEVNDALNLDCTNGDILETYICNWQKAIS